MSQGWAVHGPFNKCIPLDVQGLLMLMCEKLVFWEIKRLSAGAANDYMQMT